MHTLFKKIPIAFLVWLLIFITWIFYTECIQPDAVMIPSPQIVWTSFLETLKNGYGGVSLAVHLRSSFVRLFLAMVLAFFTAVPLGFLSGYSRLVQSIVDSIVQFYRPIPPLAYYPLLILWLGIDDRSKITLLYLSAFAPLYICLLYTSPSPRDS